MVCALADALRLWDPRVLAVADVAVDEDEVGAATRVGRGKGQSTLEG